VTNQQSLRVALGLLGDAMNHGPSEPVFSLIAEARDTIESALPDEPRPSHIKTWRERCDELHDDMVIVTSSMVQQRMQEEIDDLRAALNRPEGTK